MKCFLKCKVMFYPLYPPHVIKKLKFITLDIKYIAPLDFKALQR